MKEYLIAHWPTVLVSILWGCHIGLDTWFQNTNETQIESTVGMIIAGATALFKKKAMVVPPPTVEEEKK